MFVVRNLLIQGRSQDLLRDNHAVPNKELRTHFQLLKPFYFPKPFNQRSLLQDRWTKELAYRLEVATWFELIPANLMIADID